MGWKSLTTIQLSKDWQFSSIVKSKCFRFRLIVPQSIIEPLKVNVALSIFNDNDVDFLDIQTINFGKAKSIIVSFKLPNVLLDKRVATKQDSIFFRHPSWLLNVDYYEDDSNNYSETDITEIVSLKVSEHFQNQGLIKSSNFLGTIEENLGYFSPSRNMFSVVGEKDSNFGVFSNDVSTLFLGVTKNNIGLEELTNLKNKEDWYKFNITEWVLISDRPQKQSSLYLDAFSLWGLQPYGEMKWRSFNGRIVFCEVRNADGSWYINKVKQEIANAS